MIGAQRHHGNLGTNDLLTNLHNSWSMDETTSVMVDDVGSHDLTVTGTPTRGVTGVRGKAVKSNASGDYLSGGSTTSHKKFHGPADFKMSVECWLQFPSGAGSYDAQGVVIGTNIFSGSGGSGFSLVYDDRSSVPISRSVKLFVTSDVAFIVAPHPLNVFPDDTAWHQCIYTLDTSLTTSTSVLYVDGVNQSGASHLSGYSYNKVFAPQSSPQDDSLYKPHLLEYGNSTFPLTGVNVDMVRLWDDRVLTQGDVTRLYNYGVGLPYSRFE